MKSGDPRSSSSNRALPLLLLLILSSFYVLFFKLGDRGFENKDTLWYVEIAWEMLRSGDWIVPRFNTVIFTEKPILFIWLVSAFSRLAGAITPFTTRLPSALAGLGTILLAYSTGRKLFNARSGILAGFILLTSYAFAWEARTCMVDMLFTFFITLSLYLFLLGLSRPGEGGRLFIAGYAAVGLAALTKGPIGIVFPAIVVFFYLLVARRPVSLRGFLVHWGILIIIGMQAAWYIPYLLRIGPDGRRFFFEMYVYKENFLRFATGFDHYEPFWFYAPAFLSHFLPWSPFLIFSLFLPRSPEGRDRRYPAVWFLSILAFLTLSSGKHSRYALPLYPAAALLVSDFWERMMSDENSPWIRPSAVIVAAAGIVVAVCLPLLIRSADPELLPTALIFSAALFAMIAALLIAAPRERAPLAFACLAAGFIFAWSAYIMWLPSQDARRVEHQRLAFQISPAVGKANLSTYNFGRRLALGFFTGRPAVYIDREDKLLEFLRSREQNFCLMEAATYEKVKNRLPASARVIGDCRYRKAELVLVSNR